MFPDFQYLLHGLTGLPIPEWVGIFKTFGLLVALAFLAGARVLVAELKRKEQQGLLKPFVRRVKEKAKKTPENPNPIEEEKDVLVYPHMMITEIVFAAAAGGIIGAKLFNAFETWSDFIQDPIGNLFSRSGLTFYGGFIVATLVLFYYMRRFKIPFRHICDAAAPAIMIAYAVGRLGCQLSGDGDWGIYNTAYITNVEDGSLREATEADKSYVAHVTMGTPGKSYKAPAGIPVWLVAQNYPHNVGYEGLPIKNCTGTYCNVLPAGVYPTPIYEFLAGTLLFALMMGIRKKLKYPLHMFACYLVFAGVERFFVELVRVNSKYDLGFIHPSQAEIISVILVLTGISIWVFYRKKEEVV